MSILNPHSLQRRGLGIGWVLAVTRVPIQMTPNVDSVVISATTTWENASGVGGILPLVLMPGSGSELYRGLGAVVVGGLAISTVFTLILMPAILGVVFDLHRPAESVQPSLASSPA